jgi:hypothetical protein
LAQIDPAHLSRAERGQGALSIGALLRLARVLGLGELAYHLEQYDRGDLATARTTGRPSPSSGRSPGTKEPRLAPGLRDNPPPNEEVRSDERYQRPLLES